ncbi:Hypothetical protein UVM_LOCUS194 [uncultured virus]|nr:Hypothetical protein UVM_LOCUS194 [uncultured virus]
MTTLYSQADTTLSISSSAVQVYVASDDQARLMYYLHCVDTCLPGVLTDVRLGRFRDYLYLRHLKQDVVALARVLDPSRIMASHVFVEVPSAAIRDGLWNDFWKIELAHTVRKGFEDESISLAVAGRTVLAAKRMIFCPQWRSQNYTDPLRHLQNPLVSLVTNRDPWPTPKWTFFGGFLLPLLWFLGACFEVDYGNKKWPILNRLMCVLAVGGVIAGWVLLSGGRIRGLDDYGLMVTCASVLGSFALTLVVSGCLRCCCPSGYCAHRDGCCCC